jgi:trehalose 6-phosphate phosphatase
MVGDTNSCLLANPPDQSIEDLLAPLTRHPERAALLCDFDGTLAPIERIPDRVELLPGAREVLSALAVRYALVACVSGRRVADVRRLVGVGAIAYIGSHGLECLPAGAGAPRMPASFEAHAAEVSAFARDRFGEELRALGVRLEDKHAIWSFHWRDVPDEERAREALERVAHAAAEHGLRPHWGRKVLEIRPSLHFDKGTAVAELLAGTHVSAALYAGDDTTDIDAFRELRGLRRRGRLEHVLCVGVRSAEGPAAIVEEADLVVEGPGGTIELLTKLLV